MMPMFLAAFVPEWAREIVGWFIKGAAAVLVAFGVYKSIEHRVVRKEQARVEATGAKTNAKAQQKRAEAESRPDLSRWMRD